MTNVVESMSSINPFEDTSLLDQCQRYRYGYAFLSFKKVWHKMKKTSQKCLDRCYTLFNQNGRYEKFQPTKEAPFGTLVSYR
eukprot:g4933.t1